MSSTNSDNISQHYSLSELDSGYETNSGNLKDNAKLPNNNLKNKRGKVYKTTDEVRLKISQAHKARKTIPVAGIKKGQKGLEHPAYKHGKGKTRDYEANKNTAWIYGVKKKFDFQCFINSTW